MDEYRFEIHTPDAVGTYALRNDNDDNRIITAFNVDDATRKAENMAANVYSRYRIKNLRLTKKFTNPDNEI